MHQMMDWPAQFLGPNHRIVGHDAYSIAILAFFNALNQAFSSSMTGGNFWNTFAQTFGQNIGAGALHVFQDESFSWLKQLAGNANQYDRSPAQIQKDLARKQQPAGNPALDDIQTFQKTLNQLLKGVKLPRIGGS